MVQDPHAGATPAPDAVALLMADHREAKALFERYEGLVRRGADGEHRRALAEIICVMLTVHTTAEEELFYPAALQAAAAHDALHEARVEHHSARHLIADIVSMTAADPRLDATVKVLGEYVDHHVREEEGELFPKVRETGLDLGRLGARLAARKEELMAEMEEFEG